MKYEVERVKRFGKMAVYRRKWREPGLSLYFVHNYSTNKSLEDFKRLSSAIKWARANQEG